MGPATQLYNESGGDKRLLLSFVLGLDGCDSLKSLLSNTKKVRDVKPTAQMLKDEVRRRRQLAPHHQDKHGAPVSGMNANDCTQWLSRNPIQDPHDVLFLLEELSRFQESLRRGEDPNDTQEAEEEKHKCSSALELLGHSSSGLESVTSTPSSFMDISSVNSFFSPLADLPDLAVDESMQGRRVVVKPTPSLAALDARKMSLDSSHNSGSNSSMHTLSSSSTGRRRRRRRREECTQRLVFHKEQLVDATNRLRLAEAKQDASSREIVSYLQVQVLNVAKEFCVCDAELAKLEDR